MKKTLCPRSWLFLFAIAMAVFVVGCVPKRVVWSPDGKMAFVLGEAGLYLSDAEGKLSSLQVSNVSVAAWFPDSRRLALVRTTKLNSWPEIKPRLGADVRERIEQAGQNSLAKVKAGKEFSNALADSKIPDGNESSMLIIYLKSLEGVEKLAGTNWNSLQSAEVELTTLQTATVNAGKVDLGGVLSTGFSKIDEIRIAPGGNAIACATENVQDDDFSLSVLPLDNSSTSELVSQHAAWYPDWSADGKALLYIGVVGEKGTNDQLRLGTLARRVIFNDSGKMEVQQGQDDLAGLLFDKFNKVRCLSDGRILFSGVDIHLPATATDMPQRQKLYELDTNRQAGVIPLIPSASEDVVPELVAFFEPSPDGKRVSIAGKNGDVVVLTLATGNVQQIQSPIMSRNTMYGSDDWTLSSVPVWRSSNELCFVSITNINGVQSGQVALWSDGKARVLSKDWSSEIRKGFLEK